MLVCVPQAHGAAARHHQHRALPCSAAQCIINITTPALSKIKQRCKKNLICCQLIVIVDKLYIIFFLY